jgi:hypothetical protein
MSLLSNLSGWAEAHPELVAALVWPLFTAILTWLVKPRTAAEYAAMSPRLAAAIKLVSALGLDPVKAVEALKQIFGPKKPPTGPSARGAKRLDGIAVLCFVGILLLLVRITTGCTAAGRWHAANVVLDVLQCVLANEKKPDAEVVALCAGENVSPDDVRKVLAQQRAALAEARHAGVCAPDAGH